MAELLEWLRGVVSRPAVQAGSVFGAAAVGVATVVVLMTDPWSEASIRAPTEVVASALAMSAAPGPAAPGPAAPGPAAPGPGVGPQVDICPSGSSGATLAPGQGARCQRDLVLEVPADEGFWIQAGPANRLWVQLTGAADLSRQGTHVEIAATDLAIAAPAR